MNVVGSVFADVFPRGNFGACWSLAVHVNHGRQLWMVGVDVLAIANHLPLKLVQYEHFLGENILASQGGEPSRNLIHLPSVHMTDALQGLALLAQLPLGIKSQTNMGFTQQFFVVLGLLQHG